MKGIMLAALLISIPTLACPSSPPGQALFEKECGGCHSLQKSLDKKRSQEGWYRTVRRMEKYSDKTLSEEEVNLIAQFLARPKAGPETVDKNQAKETTPKQGDKDHSLFDFEKVKVDQFIDPPSCGECHSEKFEQWSGSMHSKAFTDELWRAASKLFFKSSTETEELIEMKACVKCHTPLGFRSYSISSPEDDYNKLASLPAQGIFCNWCHNISEVKAIGDAAYEVAPGGGEEEPATMLGPFKDAYSDYHPTKYSELHTKSEFCGLCHNVSHAANHLPIEATYDEWRNSPYNTGNPDTTVTCQDCHMRQRPGIPATGKTERPDNPGQGADNGPDRKHVWTHYFVGANVIMTRGRDNEVHSKMAIERLRHAADMEIIKKVPPQEDGLARIGVKVTNSGAGHYLPTGITEIRQMWLDVKITDATGRLVFRSGALDENGTIEEKAVRYYTQLGDKAGEPVINVAKADRILHDHRIPPQGYVLEEYAFIMPAEAKSPLKVEAALNYRSCSQGLAKTLLGDKSPEIPVIEMVRAAAEIRF